MIPLPRNLTDPMKLADWLELSALEAKDRNASVGDLSSALQIPLGSTDDDLQQQVMSELDHREKAAGDSYPFTVAGARVLQCRGGWGSYVPYVFCLCLSYFTHKVRPGDVGRELFESLCTVAARHYLCGSAMEFGIRCKRGTKPFENAVADLCRSMGEGRGYVQRTAKDKQDDQVDIVAWKAFADGLPSQLVLFGQCASGDNWTSKVNELNPTAFCKMWLAEPTISPLIQSFFIPHTILRDEWNYYAVQDHILFDRCRVAYWSHREGGRSTDSRYADWCKIMVPSLP